MYKYTKYSPIILRIGLALVFLWFGMNQISNTVSWVDYVPEWAVRLSSLSADTIVRLNGVFEILFGTALLFGFFTQIAAFLLFLHIAGITFTIGFDPTGIRDLGLTVAMLSVWLNGVD